MMTDYIPREVNARYLSVGDRIERPHDGRSLSIERGATIARISRRSDGRLQFAVVPFANPSATTFVVVQPDLPILRLTHG